MANNISKRGFGSMSQSERRRIAVMGGKASKGNFKYDRARAVTAGRKGGKNSHKNDGK